MKKASTNSQLIPNIFASKNIWHYTGHTVLPQFVPKCSHGFSMINSIFQNCIKKHSKPKVLSAFGAAGRIWTADLILTKDALYLLSYSSIWRPRWGSNPRPPAWQAGVLTNWTTWPHTTQCGHHSRLNNIANSACFVNLFFIFFLIFIPSL